MPQVTCDGEPLTLSDDIEGILFLYINSNMGGVDLWASGQSSAGLDVLKLHSWWLCYWSYMECNDCYR